MTRTLALAVLLIFVCACPAPAQYTAVSATVKDTSGNLYQNGTWNANFVPPASVPSGTVFKFQGQQWNGPTTVVGTMDGFANMSISLPDNNQITPLGSQWQFTFSAKAASPCFSQPSFSVTLTVTGASQNITAAAQAASAPLLPPCGPTIVVANINVNGGAVSSPNFSSTLPAAQNGFHIGTFQTSGQNISVEVPSYLPSFYVKDYGTNVGTGGDDTAAYNAAALACNGGVGGGAIVFGAATYNLTSPNSPNPGVYAGTNAQVCSIVGQGVSNTKIIMHGTGMTLSNQLILEPFYGGDVSGITFEISNQSSGAYCLRILDSVGWNIHECAFSNATQTSGLHPVLYEVNSKFCERNHIENTQFWLPATAIEALFDTGTSGDFAYNFFLNNHYNQGTGDIFFSTGTSGGGVLGNVFTGQANFSPTVGTNANWFHVTGTGNKIGPGNRFDLRDENDGAGTRSDFCIDPGVIIAAGTSLTGFIMAESGGMIGCVGTQAVNTNLDVWGRGYYAAQNGLYWGTTLNSTSGAPTPVGRLNGGGSIPGTCDNGLGSDPAGSIFTVNAITGSGANGTTFWGCTGQNYNPFVLRQGTTDLTGQTNNVGNTTVTTATATGMFRMSCYTVITTPATTSTLPICTAAWTDGDNSAAQQSNATLTGSGCTPTQATNTTQTNCNATWVFNAKTGTNIQFFTSGYASSPANTMAYSVHVRVEPL